MTHSKIKNTKDEKSQFIKVLVHGPAGSGKTRLCATTGGKPLIVSAESGLLSLREYDLDVWEVKNMQDLKEVFEFLKDDKTYDWICLDSISEIAETVLSNEKKATKDGRAAYGNMADIMTTLIRSFRDLPKNVYMSSKQGKVKDEQTGGVYHGPMMPGQTLTQGISYFFDEVFALHSWKDEEGNYKSAFQTRRDNQFEAKDRSGALSSAEEANLGKVFAKIMNNQTNQKEVK